MKTPINEIIQVVKDNLRVDLFDIESEKEFHHYMELEHDLQMKIVFEWHLSSIDFYISDKQSEKFYQLRIWSNFTFPEPDHENQDYSRLVEGTIHNIYTSTRNDSIPYYMYKSECKVSTAIEASSQNSDITPVLEALERRDYIAQLEREIVTFLASFKDEHVKKHVERWNAKEDVQAQRRKARLEEKLQKSG